MCTWIHSTSSWIKIGPHISLESGIRLSRFLAFVIANGHVAMNFLTHDRKKINVAEKEGWVAHSTSVLASVLAGT